MNISIDRTPVSDSSGCTAGGFTESGFLFLRRLSFVSFASSAAQLLPVLLDQGLRSGATFLAGLLVARACDKEEYGLYTLLYTILVSLLAFQAGLVGTPYVALSALRVGDEKRHYLGSALVLHLLTSGVAVLAILLLGAMLGRSEASPVPTVTVFVFSLALIPILFREFWRQVLMADLHVWKNLFFGLPIHVLSIVLLLGLYQMKTLTVRSAYLAPCVCSLFPIALLLYGERCSIRFRWDGFLGHVAQNWQMGRWLLAKAVLTVVSVFIYGWALAAFHGTASVGLYGACILPISCLSPLAQALAAYMTPKAAHTAGQGFRAVRNLAIASTVATMAPLLVAAGLLLVFSRPLMDLLFKGKYVVSPYLTFLFALHMTLLVASTSICSCIVALRRSDVSFKAELIAVVVTLCFGVPLVYSIGIWGAAIGLLVSCSCNMLYQWVAFFRLMGDTTHRLSFR